MPQEIDLDEAMQLTNRRHLEAIPIDPEKINSPLLTASHKALAGIRKVIGQSDYRAYAGTYTGGLNGCFWIDIRKKLPNGEILIENLHDVGKIKVEAVQTALEPDLVYPLLRGRDVARWKAQPSAHIILAQVPATRRGVPEMEMKRKFPKTYAYLKRFEPQLRKRASSSVRRLMETGPFYSMFAVGPYTMSEWKVLWPEVG